MGRGREREGSERDWLTAYSPYRSRKQLEQDLKTVTQEERVSSNGQMSTKISPLTVCSSQLEQGAAVAEETAEMMVMAVCAII